MRSIIVSWAFLIFLLAQPSAATVTSIGSVHLFSRTCLVADVRCGHPDAVAMGWATGGGDSATGPADIPTVEYVDPLRGSARGRIDLLGPEAFPELKAEAITTGAGADEWTVASAGFGQGYTVVGDIPLLPLSGDFSYEIGCSPFGCGGAAVIGFLHLFDASFIDLAADDPFLNLKLAFNLATPFDKDYCAAHPEWIAFARARSEPVEGPASISLDITTPCPGRTLSFSAGDEFYLVSSLTASAVAFDSRALSFSSLTVGYAPGTPVELQQLIAANLQPASESVPAPGAIGLLAFGVVCIAGLRRRT